MPILFERPYYIPIIEKWSWFLLFTISSISTQPIYFVENNNWIYSAAVIPPTERKATVFTPKFRSH